MSKESSSNADKKEKVPPGWAIGPDGKPCKICTAFRNWKPKTSNTNATANMMAGLAAGTTAVGSRSDGPPPDCPPDVEQLGRATWTFLHTTAAYYPENPTQTHRVNMLSLLRSLPLLYPCTNCALDFGEDLKINPPDVSSRLGLSQWLCERHNEVNTKLGKKKFDCAKTDERWKDGTPDGRCD